MKKILCCVLVAGTLDAAPQEYPRGFVDTLFTPLQMLFHPRETFEVKRWQSWVTLGMMVFTVPGVVLARRALQDMEAKRVEKAARKAQDARRLKEQQDELERQRQSRQQEQTKKDEFGRIDHESKRQSTSSTEHVSFGGDSVVSTRGGRVKRRGSGYRNKTR